jgi:hypothetical protein
MDKLVKLINCLAITVVIFILYSCDAEHTKEYYVKNILGDTVWFKYKKWDKADSVIFEGSATKLVYTHNYVNGTVGVEDDRFYDNISHLQIRKGTTIKDIDEGYWTYEKVSKYYAKYTIIIDTTLIK